MINQCRNIFRLSSSFSLQIKVHFLVHHVSNSGFLSIQSGKCHILWNTQWNIGNFKKYGLIFQTPKNSTTPVPILHPFKNHLCAKTLMLQPIFSDAGHDRPSSISYTWYHTTGTTSHRQSSSSSSSSRLYRPGYTHQSRRLFTVLGRWGVLAAWAWRGTERSTNQWGIDSGFNEREVGGMRSKSCHCCDR